MIRISIPRVIEGKAARVPAEIEQGVWKCDNAELKAVLDCLLLDGFEYHPNGDLELAELATSSYCGSIVSQPPATQLDPDLVQ